MAPKTKQSRFHLTSSTSFIAGICLFVLIVLAFPTQAVWADSPAITTTVPNLSSFTSSIQHGQGKVIRGAYVDGLFALPILQQPSNNAAFVSTVDNTLTQFGMASQFGNVGLLAHNYLSGQFFFELTNGTVIQLIYGDGRIETYQVTHIYRYQATSPYSVSSDFVDLDTLKTLTASELFIKVYKGPRHVTFQTCISQDGNTSWGRYFVIAEPK
jgi:hypothetical protein